MTADADLISAEALAEPAAFFRRLVGEERVFWSARWKGWILTRHADVVAVLSDPRFSAEAFARFEESLSDRDRARWPNVRSCASRSRHFHGTRRRVGRSCRR